MPAQPMLAADQRDQVVDVLRSLPWELILVAFLALVLGAIVVGMVVESSRKRRRRGLDDFHEVRALSQEDVDALGRDLTGLTTTMQAIEDDDDVAVRHYATAHEFYDQAVERLERASRPQDLAGVSSALEAGRFYMTSARSVIEGHGALRRLPPCFFDTRHGPGVEDVGWMPPRGSARPVPACAACMRLIEEQAQPPVRLVRTGGNLVPFYEAPPYFESWFGGYFGGTAQSLVQGFALGKALDDGFAGGLNTFGGGHGYMPPAYADSGDLVSSGNQGYMPASYADSGVADPDNRVLGSQTVDKGDLARGDFGPESREP
jgi:hypothetical protein